VRSASKHDLAVIVFSLIYMAAALASALFLHNKEFVFYLVVMVILMAVTWGVHRAIRLHPLALWGLSLWGLLHMAGGLVPLSEGWPRLGGNVLYNLWLIPGRLKYDQAVHAYGFGLMTWICWQGLQRAFEYRGLSIRPTAGLLTLCAAAGMGFGALNEVIEFIAVLSLPGTNVGGYENTGWDLVANLTGCLLAAVGIYWSEASGKKESARNEFRAT
jgi:uncharacterized membrane protein YjdF